MNVSQPNMSEQKTMCGKDSCRIACHPQETDQSPGDRPEKPKMASNSPSARSLTMHQNPFKHQFLSFIMTVKADVHKLPVCNQSAIILTFSQIK